MTENYAISFNEVSIAEANRLAIELHDYLATIENIESNIINDRTDTQDIGSILTIVLSSTSVVALATGLVNWLLKKQSRKITVKKNGDIIGENLSSGDIKEILTHTK